MHASTDPVARWIAACRHERGRLSVRLELRPSPVLELGPGCATASRPGCFRDDLDLSRDEQERLWALWTRRGERDFFERLGLAPTDDLAAIRRAYLATCRAFHPDRYFGKRVGPFAAVLADLFADARLAYEALSDPQRRALCLAERAAELAEGGPPASV